MFKAMLNSDGSAGFHGVPPGYKAREGEVLFPDPPTEAQLDLTFPGRKKPEVNHPRDPFAEIDALRARNAKLEAALAAKALVTRAEIDAAAAADGK